MLFSIQADVMGGALWESGTANLGSNCHMDFQADGNLVVYDAAGAALWASGSSGTSGAELHLQADGNVVLYNGAGLPLWQSSTNHPVEYNLLAGELSLSPPQILHSWNRKLEMQADCDLVLFSFENALTGGILWRSDTAGFGSHCRADFQADGNFVVYDEFNTPGWASGTSGTSGGVLRLQEDGNLVVYNGAGEPLWSANSNIPAEFSWDAGQFSLLAGQYVQSQNRKLILQSDCNLVLLNVSNAIVGGPLWHSDTAGNGGNCQLDFQADGNFVVYDDLGQARWASGTSGTTNARLRLQEDGNLVVYNGAEEPLWETSTPGTFENVWICGDFSCNGTETCSLCSLDCGVCEGGGGGTPLPLLSEEGLALLLLFLAGSALANNAYRIRCESRRRES